MSINNEPDGKNSLVGEFLLALARSPESVQENIIVHGLKQMLPYSATLIEPYPMLSHLLTLMGQQNKGGGGSKGSTGTGGRDH